MEGCFCMGKTVKLEYDDNQYVEIELKQSDDYDGGLGGLDTIIEVGQRTFDHSIYTLVSFLNSTVDKIKQGLSKTNLDEISITIGASLSAEGNLIIASSTSEVNLSVTVTFRGES